MPATPPLQAKTAGPKSTPKSPVVPAPTKAPVTPVASNPPPSSTIANAKPNELNPTKPVQLPFDRSKVTLDKGLKIVEDIFDNMMLANGTGLMMAGDPGVGKTTFIKRLSKLIGLPVIVIEAPHVTEEHLINIPFLVFDPVSGSDKASAAKIDTQNFSVTLAKSHLASQLAAAQPVPENEYKNAVSRFDENLKSFFHLLGGSEDALPPDIIKIRNRYRVILFLDEYFRQTSSNVRNILRGILNGRIGNDKIPAGTFIIYASNLSDTGDSIEDIPLNADFKKIDFDNPSKDEWFHYFVSKFEKDERVKLKPVVVDTFYHVLSDEHMSHNDVESEIRTSPRRWEQLLLYINESVPVENEDEASELLTNVRANFRDQGKVSSVFNLVDTATKEIIEKTSGIKNVKVLTDADWRRTLEHQIKTKIKLGDHRSYIPVIQGLPGIGKTAQIHTVAEDLNLRLIAIDASTLTVDDITGIPIPGNKQGQEMNVSFAPPALYQRIMNDIKEEDRAYMRGLNPEKTDEYKKQEYKYIIFFDEINRVKSVNVFNALRRVVLEKSFTDEFKLPSSAVVVAALNPHDKGTTQLTDHFKDVIDRIDTSPSWEKLSSFLQLASQHMEGYSNTAKNLSMKVLHAFADQFTPKMSSYGGGNDSNKFYINMKDSGEIYISPREYSTMYDEMVAASDRVLGRKHESQDDLQNALISALSRKMISTLSWVLTKQEVDSPQLLDSINSWLKTSGIVQKSMTKKRTEVGLSSILSGILQNPNQDLADDLDFNNYINTFELNKFSEDFGNFLHGLVSNKEKAVDSLIAKTHAKKAIRQGVIQQVNDFVSEFEFLAREILHACKIHKLSNEVIDQVGNTMAKAIQNVVDGDETIDDDDFMKVLSANHELQSELQRLARS